ncbi:MAG: non-canonical purine NTP pyrophosphatase, partial [Pyrinomonadaceae bacterium]
MILDPGFEILIASHNPGKIREVQEALHSLPLKMRYLDEFAYVSLVDEVGKTYEENAVLKALSYAKQTGICALADDSGLEVDALDGNPGVYSARFGGENVSDHDRIQKLLAVLSEQESSSRDARFVCCMALAGWQPTRQQQIRSAEPRLLNVTEANCEGAIVPQPQGLNGFGFDPVFVPKGYLATFAELPCEVKARISHRAQA